MESLSWFYDALAIGLMLIFMYVGAKRGLLRNAVLIVLVAASLLASWFVSEAASPFVYDKFVKDKIVEGLTTNAANSDPAAIVSQSVSDGGYGVEMTKDEVSSIIEDDSDFFTMLAKEMRKNGSPETEETIKNDVEAAITSNVLDVLLKDVTSSAYITHAINVIGVAAENTKEVVESFMKDSAAEICEVTEKNIIAPLVTGLIKSVIFVVMIMILRLIITPVANSFKLVNKIPIIGPINSLLGGILGIAEGAICVYVIALAVKAVIGISGNSLIFLNEECVSATKVFMKFYNFSLSSLR